MVSITAASVPLYRMFCATTGFAGTTTRSGPSKSVGTKIITVQFDSNVDNALPWRFYPLQHEIKIKTGETAMVYFKAENKADRGIVAMAIFNVTPHKIGKYFHKIRCFCFEEQFMEANSEMTMPVLFYIDPTIERDLETQEVSLMTLSYKFFKVR